MFLAEATLLGLVQGLTEFLPVSSSAHLTLLPLVLGWNARLLNSLVFDVALHAGTLIAVLTYFRQDVVRLGRAFGRSLIRPQARQEPEAKLAWLIVVATLPAVLFALLFREQIETLFRSPLWVAGCLVGFGLLMAVAERWTRKRRDTGDLRLADALLIGCAQAISLMPGVSRSGITITAGLFLKFKREEAARFAFLLSIPAILGALVFQMGPLFRTVWEQGVVTLLAGTLAAGISGYLCIKFLLAYLRTRTLYIFVIYRVAVGLLILGWVLVNRAG